MEIIIYGSIGKLYKLNNMRILINEDWHKVSNFVNYLIENHNEEGKTYKFKLKLEDIYDKRLVANRMSQLNNKLLLLIDDSFEITKVEFSSLEDDYEEFINEKNINQENLNENLIQYQLEFIDDNDTELMNFYFLK